MFAMMRKIFSLSAYGRRLRNGLGAAFLLATILFSSVFVMVEADHDCGGCDCPICFEMQNCIASFQLLGSSPLADDALLPDRSVLSVETTVPYVRRVPATTLQLLDVRFDE